MAHPQSMPSYWRGIPLDGIQAGILKPHGRTCLRCAFLSFHPHKPGSPSPGSHWLTSFFKLAGITSADKQIRDTLYRKEGSDRYDGGPVISLHLSRWGYEYFHIPENTLPADPFFLAGMKSDFSIEALSDPRPDRWEKAFQTDPIHVLVLLADDDPDNLDALQQSLFEGENDRYISHLHIEAGQKLVRNGNQYEHFGYRDGISSLKFFDSDNHIIPDRLPLVLRQNGLNRYGSYLVFRKLRQNVAGFKAHLDALAGKLGLSYEQTAAQVMGRSLNGASILRKPGSSTGLKYAPIDFQEDPKGLVCPFHAHIRKSNPRDAVHQSDPHQIIRRGIPYGSEYRDHYISNIPEQEVGLLFMCYQSSINDQFAYIQKNWLNSPHAPYAHASKKEYFHVGIDPIAGQSRGDDGEQNWLDAGRKRVPYLFSDVVNLKGGEYFFAPSIAFLRELGPGNRGDHPPKKPRSYSPRRSAGRRGYTHRTRRRRGRRKTR